jgi:hypothetical protein
MNALQAALAPRPVDQSRQIAQKGSPARLIRREDERFLTNLPT